MTAMSTTGQIMIADDDNDDDEAPGGGENGPKRDKTGKKTALHHFKKAFIIF